MTTTIPSPSELISPPPDASVAISVRHVTKRFGGHTVLEDISFDVPRGETSCVLGPSGTGKSVLLKNIIGLLRPDEGQVLIDGEPMVGVREKEILRIRRKFGVLFQDGALFGSMNLFDNIAFPLVEHTKKSDREIRNIVLEKAEMVGLVAHLNKLPGEISGGMRKRAGLARALVLEPEIVFFDEPDSGLDPVRVAYLDRLIHTVQGETGATFFVITHNISSVKRIADNIGMLFRSGLVGFGPADEMKHSDDPVVRQFLNGIPRGPIKMDEMSEGDESDDLEAADFDGDGFAGEEEEGEEPTGRRRVGGPWEPAASGAGSEPYGSNGRVTAVHEPVAPAAPGRPAAGSAPAGSWPAPDAALAADADEARNTRQWPVVSPDQPPR